MFTDYIFIVVHEPRVITMHISVNKHVYHPGDFINVVCKLSDGMISSNNLYISFVYKEVSGIPVFPRADSIDGLGGMTMTSMDVNLQSINTIWRDKARVPIGHNEFSCRSPMIPEWMETTQVSRYTDSYAVYFEIIVKGYADMDNGGQIFVKNSKCINVEKRKNSIEPPLLEYDTVFSKNGTTRATYQKELCTGCSTVVYVEETKNQSFRRGANVKLVQKIHFRDVNGNRVKRTSSRGKYFGAGRYKIDIPDSFVDSEFEKDKHLGFFISEETYISVKPKTIFSKIKNVRSDVIVRKLTELDSE